DVVATANLFWALDTRGYVALQVRQTKRENELQAAQLHQDAQDLIARLLAAQNLAGSLRKQIEQLDQLIAFMDTAPQGSDFDSLWKAAEPRRSLRVQRFKLRRDLAELDTLFWFVDEKMWRPAS